ncbi:hypothetical protein SFR_2928 [Streptomyces sp. FR-008]|nr:hypothetical protein SFR_2928 [Streptomyces sp. FR-008]
MRPVLPHVLPRPPRGRVVDDRPAPPRVTVARSACQLLSPYWVFARHPGSNGYFVCGQCCPAQHGVAMPDACH